MMSLDLQESQWINKELLDKFGEDTIQFIQLNSRVMRQWANFAHQVGRRFHLRSDSVEAILTITWEIFKGNAKMNSWYSKHDGRFLTI